MTIKEFFNLPEPGAREHPTGFQMDSMHFTARNSVRLESDDSRIFLGGEWIPCNALPYTLEKKIPGVGSLMRGPDGGRALYLCVEVPTFDVYDRMYDSTRYAYIQRIDGELTALHFSSGYQLGRAYLYTGVAAENEAAARALDAAEL